MPENTNGKNVGEIRNKVYVIRGQKVMLDYDLAEIYGYTTSAFNQQVRRNIDKFEGEDFMFRLKSVEVPKVLLSQNVIAKMDGRGGDRRLPYAFTEQGIYMLMTVLKGDLATKQSRTLIRLFKNMKDYILDNQSIAVKTIENTENILELKTDVEDIKSELGKMIKKSEISPMVLDFTKATEAQEFLIMNGEVIKAKDAIIKIYNKAKKKICIADNYVNYNTLRLLLEVKQNLEIIIYTNNTNNYLKQSDLEDFIKERPDIKIKLIKSKNLIHDRFIILDNDKVYALGTSTKDIGSKMSIVHEVLDEPIKETIRNMIK